MAQTELSRGGARTAIGVTAPDPFGLPELGTNWPLLEEVAAKSGGKVFTPENAAALADLLVQQGVIHAEHYEFRRWQWWGTLAVFLGLLTLEWVARKWAGLP